MTAEQLRLEKPSQWARAQVLPLAVFMAFNFLLEIIVTAWKWDHPAAPWFRRYPEQWMYPVQTIVCLLILVKHWRYYEFHWNAKKMLLGVLFGAVGIGFWLLPTTLYDRLGYTENPEGWQKWLGIAARKEGFDPSVFSEPMIYWCVLIMRFMRACVVVAMAEEILWRSFIMRFANDWDGPYERQPFGKHTWAAFFASTALFTLSHGSVDYAGAIVYGTLTYILCVWQKNLSACVAMHATANLLMGMYAIHYGKLGLW